MFAHRAFPQFKIGRTLFVLFSVLIPLLAMVSHVFVARDAVVYLVHKYVGEKYDISLQIVNKVASTTTTTTTTTVILSPKSVNVNTTTMTNANGVNATNHHGLT